MSLDAAALLWTILELLTQKLLWMGIDLNMWALSLQIKSILSICRAKWVCKRTPSAH